MVSSDPFFLFAHRSHWNMRGEYIFTFLRRHISAPLTTYLLLSRCASHGLSGYSMKPWQMSR